MTFIDSVLAAYEEMQTSEFILRSPHNPWDNGAELASVFCSLVDTLDHILTANERLEVIREKVNRYEIANRNRFEAVARAKCCSGCSWQRPALRMKPSRKNILKASSTFLKDIWVMRVAHQIYIVNHETR